MVVSVINNLRGRSGYTSNESGEKFNLKNPKDIESG